MIEYLLLLIKIFIFFLVIASITFGGGMAMMPLIEELFVNTNLIDGTSLYEFVSLSELLPGPFSSDVATFIGYELGSFLGILFAIIGLFLPSIIIMTIINKKGAKLLQSKQFKSIVRYLKMAIIGFITAIAVNMFITEVFPNSDIKNQIFNFTDINLSFILIFVVVFLISKIKKLNNPFILIIVSAVLGAFLL
jgi:chromate transporter